MAYNRGDAVLYAEKWWNGRNPAYPSFEVDCTNFISQCLRAGGWSMTGYPNRSKGWWVRTNSWSFSWSVAHSLKWYLESSGRAQQVSKASALKQGDVICYDFEGDGRINHTTIVTAMRSGVPLVNAHTSDSRMRNWEYTDSSAYTPEIKYYFYAIT
ncbi:amidase domain-containing protein [Jeotgalibacillus campisalis]|uniref:Putative amidase domain-containing protein n=1 Tax=Jeotgalibacillus campisalis TaxID=220754 RepID=A0A0C2RYC9_9BACL|nr:amidase domain-containing protein [Jeotgalibacillus campisalis]KIL46809.1 hypothetical protein KR50_25060 [Jeotgalibacillus campisalis]